MSKLRKNNSGFTFVEILLVVLTLAIVGVAGYIVAKHINTKKPTAVTTISAAKSTPAKPKSTSNATPTNTPSNMKTYTDPSKAYSVSYPTDWTFKETASNGLNQTPLLDSTQVRFTPAGLSASATGQTWISISSFKSSDINAVFKQEAYAPSEAYNPQSLSINGSSALYRQLVHPVSKTDSNTIGYTDDYYAVTHNNVTLIFYFRESQQGNGATPFDASNIVPSFSTLVNSVKFLN